MITITLSKRDAVQYRAHQQARDEAKEEAICSASLLDTTVYVVDDAGKQLGYTYKAHEGTRTVYNYFCSLENPKSHCNPGTHGYNLPVYLDLIGG